MTVTEAPLPAHVPARTRADAQQARRARRWSVVAVVALLVVAFAIRLEGITAPPFDNAVARQLQSAVLARTYYFTGSTIRSPEERRVVAAWRNEDKPIEPPVMELIAAGAYRVLGYEALWLPRMLSALWWTGGVFLLYLIALRFQRRPAALATCAVFALLPFGVLASRSFQPDPLLVAAVLAAVLTILRYDEQPSPKRLAAAGVAAAIAFVIKPGVPVAIVFAVFLALGVRRVGVRAAVKSRDTAALVASVIPMFGWYAYGTLATTFLRGHVSAKVSPSLLATSGFWRGWWNQIVYVLTYPRLSGAITLLVIAAAALGVLVAKPGRARTLLVGLWIGYALYGLVFTANISTHNYYSLLLIPIVALSLGSLADSFLSRVGVSAGQAAAAVGIAIVAVAVVVAWKLHPQLADASGRAEAALYAEIGRLAGHTDRALYVDQHYGEPDRYYGWTAGTLLASGWEAHPNALARRQLSVALTARPRPSCLVFTPGPFQGRLAAFESEVARRFAVVRRTRDFAIFDLSREAGSRPDGC